MAYVSASTTFNSEQDYAQRPPNTRQPQRSVFTTSNASGDGFSVAQLLPSEPALASPSDFNMTAIDYSYNISNLAGDLLYYAIQGMEMNEASGNCCPNGKVAVSYVLDRNKTVVFSTRIEFVSCSKFELVIEKSGRTIGAIKGAP